jgi:hypothetical protein
VSVSRSTLIVPAVDVTAGHTDIIREALDGSKSMG